MTLVLPRLSDLAWDEVWELRDSPYLERFRAFAQGNLPVGVSDTEVSELISDALWKVVGRARPSGNGSVVARVAGTIPVPLGIPNPLALFRDVRDGKAERALYVDLGWLFFLQEVKERTAE
jgi:hypothetical protein